MPVLAVLSTNATSSRPGQNIRGLAPEEPVFKNLTQATQQGKGGMEPGEEHAAISVTLL